MSQLRSRLPVVGVLVRAELIPALLLDCVAALRALLDVEAPERAPVVEPVAFLAPPARRSGKAAA